MALYFLKTIEKDALALKQTELITMLHKKSKGWLSVLIPMGDTIQIVQCLILEIKLKLKVELSTLVDGIARTINV